MRKGCEPMQMTGAEIMVKVLAEEGVTTVFGYPGGAILPFYDALRDSKIEHILTAHEQGAAHAADGFALGIWGKVRILVSEELIRDFSGIEYMDIGIFMNCFA